MLLGLIMFDKGSATCMCHDHIVLDLTDKTWGKQLQWTVLIERSRKPQAMRRISSTTFIEQVTSSISELVGEQMIKEAVYFTESPELCVKSVSIYGCLPQDMGLNANQVNLWEDIVVVHVSFQGKWHLLSTILNKKPLQVFHWGQMRRLKCIDIKKYAEEQNVWAETKWYTVDNFRQCKSVTIYLSV